jgi:hypothetical protein
MATNIDNRDVNRFRTYAGLDTSPESNMNWGDIATEVSKGIGLIKKDRETRKAAIDQAQVDQLKALSEVPDLNNRSLNGIIIDGSDSTKQVTVNMYNELKKGNIKVKDFMLFMQNQKNGYSSMSSAVKNYDGWYTKAKERLGTDKNGNIIASDLNIYSNESIDGFGNLNNKKLVPNPVNGQLQLVTMLKDKNGNYTIMPDPNKNPNNFQNPNAINVRMNFEEDRKVLSDQAAQLTDSIAKKITSRQFDGSISSIEDFRQASVFGKWKKDSVASLTSSDNDSAQILTQSGGYKFAGSIEEFRKKHPGLSEDLFIKVDTSGDQPLVELTQEQREAARGYADTAIESQLDQIEKIQTPTRDPNTPSKMNQKNKEENIVGFLDEMNTVLSDPDKVKSKQILDRRIANKNKELNAAGSATITDVDITDDEITIYYSDGRIQPTRRAGTQNDSYAIFNFLSPEAGDGISTPVLDKYVKNAGLIFGESNILTRDQVKENYTELTPEDKAELLNIDANKNKTDEQLLKIQQEKIYQENTLSSKASQKPVEYIKGGNVLNSEGVEVSADEFVDSELSSNIQRSFDPPEQVQKEMVRLLGADGFLPVDGAGNGVFKEGDISVTINDDREGLTFKIGSTVFSIDKMYPMKTDAMITQIQNAVEREVKNINKNRVGTKGRRQRSKSKAPR